MENKIFLDRYRLSLGRSGRPVHLHRSPAAQTYRAQEMETGREVALSLVIPKPNEPVILDRLKRHAVAAQRISHLSIPRLCDFGWDDDALIYVHEYCEGPTAAAWVAARGPLAPSAAMRLALQIVDAMHVTAFDGLYHPALNPENIIFVAGQASEGDWPVIKVLHWFLPPANLAGSEAELDGTALFASPEQLQDGLVDMRSEIYSLGATTLFLLTGIAPGAVPGVPPPTARLRGAPKIVRHLLDRMLRVNSEERPQDPVALAAYFQTCLSRIERREKFTRYFSLPATAQPPVAVKKNGLPRPIQSLAVATIIVALAALTILFLPRPLGKRIPSVTETHATLHGPVSAEVVVPRNDPVPRSNDRVQTEAMSGAANSASVSRSDTPRNELATTAVSESPEPFSPAEGPPDSTPAPAPAIAQESPSNNPAGTITPNESNLEHSASSVVAEKSGTPAAVAPSFAAEVTPVAEAEADSTAASKAATSIRTPSRASKKARTFAAREKNHVAKRHRAVHTVRRAQPVPDLHVGGSAAELVGTTSDGRWVLSVTETGERVIVPPPPGFDQ